MSATPLLSVRHAEKHFGGTPALVDAALDLLPGEVHALMGENGAGKSTLIKILAGVVNPDRAEIALSGQAVSIPNPQTAFDLGLRFIHQELAVVPQLSVAENLFLSHAYPRRAGFLVDWRRLNQSAKTVLDQLGIAHIDPRTRMARVGTGDQMLVKIASAFVTGDRQTPAVYIMDEPTAALTSEEVTRLFGVIRELKLQGCAVLYVSHRLEEIFQIADRVTVMRDGCVVGSALINETSSEKLIRQMTGRELSQTFPARETPLDSHIVLAVRNLATEYVCEVSFDLRAGEILGLAGLAGAGCTELLRALVGADPLRHGEIRLDGETRADLTPVSAWERGFAYVPEERRSQGLILSRSIRDNITLPHLQKISRGGILLDRRSEEQLSSVVGASVRLKAIGPRQTVRELSGGNQQKVMFARAMSRTPRLLLLDEPTRGVDVGAKFDIYTLIRQVSAQSVGVVLASSDLAELLGLCDRILILREGRQTAIVAASGLSQHELLTLCYGDGDRDD